MVSIVIPTHGNSDAFAKCVESVRKYTDLSNDNIEVIVVANGSTPDILKHCEDFHVLWYEKELGASECYNKGWRAAHGDIIITLDDDCVLLPQPIDEWVNLLTKPFYDNGVGAVSPFAHHYKDIGMVVHSGCTAYRVDALETVGGWDTAFGKQFFMDCDVSAQISKCGYKVIDVGTPNEIGGVFSINFPVYHPPKDRQGMDRTLFMQNYERFYHRNSKFVPEASIIIPSYKGQYLKECVESVISNTTTPIEIIVVANGLPQDMVDWVFGRVGGENNYRVRLLLYNEPLGFPKAVNEGIRNANSNTIVLMNDDVQILDWGKDIWLTYLTEPLKNPKVAITGPVKFKFICGENMWDSMGFSLVAIPARVFAHIGLLDEIFTPGAGEDGDFSIRAQVNGYSIVRVPSDESPQFGDGGFDPHYPTYHVGSATWATLEGASASIERNKEILYQRWGRK
jgi:GT2 family glycosyltransferase